MNPPFTHHFMMVPHHPKDGPDPMLELQVGTRGKISWPDDVAKKVSYSYTQGIVKRDPKPNVFLIKELGNRSNIFRPCMMFTFKFLQKMSYCDV